MNKYILNGKQWLSVKIWNMSILSDYLNNKKKVFFGGPIRPGEILKNNNVHYPFMEKWALLYIWWEYKLA